MTENEKLSIKLMVMSNVNNLLVTRVTEPQKQQVKIEQYSRRNSVEISDISNDVPDENLEGKVINICKEAGKHLKPFDIEDVIDYHQDILAPATTNV